jgi:hypothetical protein
MSNGQKLVVAVLLSFLLGISGTWVMAHGGDTNLIHSCVNSRGGIRIVSATSTCPAGQTPLDWSIGTTGGGGLIAVQGHADSSTTPVCVTPWGAASGSCGYPVSGVYVPSDGKLVALVVVPQSNVEPAGRVFVMVNGIETGLSVDVPANDGTVRFAQLDVPFLAGDRIEIAALNSGVTQPLSFVATLEYRPN